jgi:hypothetical protein
MSQPPSESPQPPAPPGKLPAVDLTESVAGEEDPGASIGMPLGAPPGKPATGGDACPRCGGSGTLASGTCPDCHGSGKRPASAQG